jgi:hypothetical protein
VGETLYVFAEVFGPEKVCACASSLRASFQRLENAMAFACIVSHDNCKRLHIHPVFCRSYTHYTPTGAYPRERVKTIFILTRGPNDMPSASKFLAIFSIVSILSQIKTSLTQNWHYTA